MLYTQKINCPICDTEMVQSGGGFADVWEIQECEICGNHIDFYTGMLAKEPLEIAPETKSSDSLVENQDTEEAEFIFGEVLDEKRCKLLIQNAFTGLNGGYITYHANSTESNARQLEQNKSYEEIERILKDKWEFKFEEPMLTAELVNKVKNNELSTEEMQELLIIFACKSSVRASKILRLEDNINTYERQATLRREYLNRR